MIYILLDSILRKKQILYKHDIHQKQNLHLFWPEEHVYKPHFVFNVLNILKNFVNTDIYWERLSLLENLSTRRQPENGKILYNGVSTGPPALFESINSCLLSKRKKGLIKLIFIKLQKVDKKWQFLQKP